MNRDDYLEELLLKYDPDELLDIFFSTYNLTIKEFCDRFDDYIQKVQEDEVR